MKKQLFEITIKIRTFSVEDRELVATCVVEADTIEDCRRNAFSIALRQMAKESNYDVIKKACMDFKSLIIDVESISPKQN